MFSDLFDSPWKVLIIAAVVLVLFGAKKMPDAARSLGKSMRILKTEMHNLHEDEPASSSGAQPVPPPQQINGAAAAPSVPVAESAHENQPS
jgi:sec-independent protein translocase protein TatA